MYKSFPKSTIYFIVIIVVILVVLLGIKLIGVNVFFDWMWNYFILKFLFGVFR